MRPGRIFSLIGAQQGGGVLWRSVELEQTHSFSLLLSLLRGTNSAGGGGWGKVIAGTAVGWLAGAKFHSRRLKKKLDNKHKEEQKALYQQYYNDVYRLQQQNAELMATLEQYAGRQARA
jgi:hypothetical protein